MGRVHKKKLAEYAEAAETEVIKNNSKDSENDVDKNYASNDESEGGNVSNAASGSAPNSAAKKDATEEEEDDSKSAEGERVENSDPLDEPENSQAGKRAPKRKAAVEKVAKKASEANNESNDDEPLNGTAASAPKKGRKTAAAVKEKAAPKAKATKGKEKAVKNKDEDEDVADDDAPEEEYEVKDVVGSKVERGVTYFLIRWKGYGEDDDTWEAEGTLSCPELIEKFKKKVNDSKTLKKKAGPATVKNARAVKGSAKTAADPSKEWEVEKIIDYAEEKTGRIFRIRWKGFSAKHDTWEPEENLCCDEIIDKFLKKMKSQENITFKELREEPKKTKRLVNETTPRDTNSRHSKRAVTKKRVYYGDSDE